MKHFLSSVPFVLCNLMSPDTGGGSGGDNTPKPAEPTGDTLEAKHTSALQIIKDYFSQLSGAMSERDTAVTNLANVTAERDGAVAKRDELQGEVTRITGELSTMTSARDGEKTRADKNAKHRDLIVAFAKGHGLNVDGIDPDAAVTEVPENDGNKTGKALFDQYQALKADPKKSKQATAFHRKHKAELQEYADSLGD